MNDIALQRPRVVAPDGYRVHTPEGVLRLDASEEGRLAKLDAVIEFLMARDGLPCSAVVATVCDALDGLGGGLPLYLLQSSGFAIPLPGHACFGGRGLHGYDIRPGTCGRVGAVAAMRSGWAQQPRPACSVYEAANLDCLAVPLRQACEQWGYGQAVGHALKLPAPTAFVPVPGWSLADARGYMAFESSGAGRVVLLRDVVQWQANARPCPLRIAVKDVVRDLSATWAASWLYITAPGDYARQMQADDCFSGERSYWDQFSKSEQATSCGLLGLLYAMRDHWGDGLPDAAQVESKGLQELEAVAIRMDVAHALWGWGAVTAVTPSVAVSPFPLAGWSALVRYRVATGGDWGLGDQVEVGLAELERRMRAGDGKSLALGAMAAELGTQRQNLDKALSRPRMRGASASSALPITMVRDGRKVV